ncbi:hypothetical protein AMJ40_06970 [candidate division TA06 bacterium DG_26]|uniref:FlgD/Vpr Ig-like domain-containing protein n=1 Tax=candidate division TA06 bacterium DG_26 TaxID=1703771 RepID=A0A0S7WF11_UNCT6|nr:MAG: hypothetical protein AMJ40_06970 [candidate division TA06 bacterium DG_26]
MEEERVSATLPFILRCAPNPLRDRTRITYGLPRKSDVQIVIYNILGQEVATLLQKAQDAGRYTVTWDGRDGSGSKVPGGLYFLRLDTGDHCATRKVCVVR